MVSAYSMGYAARLHRPHATNPFQPHDDGHTEWARGWRAGDPSLPNHPEPGPILQAAIDASVITAPYIALLAAFGVACIVWPT